MRRDYRLGREPRGRELARLMEIAGEYCDTLLFVLTGMDLSACS